MLKHKNKKQKHLEGQHPIALYWPAAASALHS